MKNEDFIIDQSSLPIKSPSFESKNSLLRILKRIQLSPESQSGCERSNSIYARFKAKYSNKMCLPMIGARSRAGENGPPMHLFTAKKVFIHWLANGRRMAEKLKNEVTPESKVLRKIRSK